MLTYTIIKMCIISTEQQDRLSMGTHLMINLWNSEYVIYATPKQAQKLQQ